MNVSFHCMAAVAVAVAVSGAAVPEDRSYSRQLTERSTWYAFLLGILGHGILDCTPHCYPIPSKVDVLLSLLFIMAVLWRARRHYRVVVAMAFLGSLFPDLLDLTPGILRSHFGIPVPLMPKVFPWHWPQYSGSLYNGDCIDSGWNHIWVMAVIVMVCVIRGKAFRRIFMVK